MRERVDLALFNELAGHIDEHGYLSHFYKSEQIYFDYDGRTYWHMDNIINRCPEADTYHRREKEGRLPHFGEETPSHLDPKSPKQWLKGPRFVEAFRVAAGSFAAKTKKGGPIPYISHLLGTCAIAIENGASEDEAIAALLHDMIEDIEPPGAAKAAVARFGPEVLRIVEGCSDSSTHPKPPWKDRKKAYIDHLEKADRCVLLVSASDKLHNARAIAADLRYEGAKVWKRFNASREEELWYYHELVRVFESRLANCGALIAELKRAVAEMERLPGPPTSE